MIHIVKYKFMNKLLKQIISITLVTFVLLSCKNKNNNSDKIDKSFDKKKDTNIINKVKNNDTLEKILEEQIKSGKSALYNNSFDITTYKFGPKDLEITIPLLSRYYKGLDNKKFGEKINEIFGRTINFNSNSKYLYINFDNKEDRKYKFYRNDNSIEVRPYSIFAIKGKNFITQLYAIPEILNYKDKYPKIAEYENKMRLNRKDSSGVPIKIFRWKDDKNISIQNNLKTFIARNKYLFDDDKSQLDWLLENDEEFMEVLISTFSYYKDKKHKNWYDSRE